jgi:DinB family protein
MQFPDNLEARRTELDGARGCLLEAIHSSAEGRGIAVSEPGRWSTAEIVYHLHLSERSIVRMLGKALASSERNEPADEGRLRAEWERIRRVVAARESKVQAPVVTIPTMPPAFDAALDLLTQSRQALVTVIAETTYDELLRISRPHPFAAVGVLSGAGWLSLIAAHEERHTRQIELLH